MVLLGKTLSQTFEILQQVYGENSMSWTCVFEWQKRFEESCKEVKDDFRSGRPSASRTEVNVEWIGQVAYGDHCLTVQMIASQLDMKKDSVWKIIPEDLGMSEKKQDWVYWAPRSSWLRETLSYWNNFSSFTQVLKAIKGAITTKLRGFPEESL